MPSTSVSLKAIPKPLPQHEGVASDTARHKGTIAWRITQNMQGCPPEMIDSVIQANIPQRIHQRSTRPDTLSIPGLPGRKTYEMRAEDIEPVYTLGFFKENPLLHPELRIREHGYSAVPVPYMLWRDDWVTGILLLCFVLLVFIVNRARHQFLLQARNFFYTPQSVETPFAKDITFEGRTVLFMTILLCLLGVFMSYAYSQYTLDLFLSQLSPYLLLSIYLGCFVAYFVLKRIAYGFVNWIFFTKAQRKLWTDACSFVLSIECLLLFPSVLVFVYFNLSIAHIASALIFILFIAKLLLSFKCYSIFFRGFHCTLHYLVYLCTLEIVPLVALWQSLTFITGNLIIEY
ncbi:MAG: DUF4271 domain-containing protein [Prevotellaceae bacterium]|nr:DUF4271 domain-containing protein [Prevotellaceae bacterium]